MLDLISARFSVFSLLLIFFVMLASVYIYIYICFSFVSTTAVDEAVGINGCFRVVITNWFEQHSNVEITIGTYPLLAIKNKFCYCHCCCYL